MDDDITINKAGYLTAVDLDADGDLDVVSSHDERITWYENDCTIKPTPAPSARPSYSPRPTHSFNPTPRPSILAQSDAPADVLADDEAVPLRGERV